MTDEEAKELLQQNRLLMENLAKASGKKKDFWDKVSSLSTALMGPLVTIAIGGVGIYFTYLYNKQQLRYAGASAVAPFMTYITGTDPVAKGHAVQVITYYEHDLGILLSQTYQSEKDKFDIARPAEKTCATGTDAGVLPTGDIAVHAGEIVTVKVTAQGTVPLVAWSVLSYGTWLKDSPLERSFVVTSNPVNSFAVAFSFSEKTGGKYHITIKWGKGHSCDEAFDQLDSPSMAPISRSFDFAVRQ